MPVNYGAIVSPRSTPQSEPIFGSTNQVQNSAGGFVYAVDHWTQLDRFLILGSEGGSYYATERKLTRENAQGALAAIQESGVRVVQRLVEISVGGRAPKNDPALLVLALVLTYGSDEAKQAAYAAIPQVARTGTHFLHLLDYVTSMRGLGRQLKRALGSWYTTKTPMELAQQFVKYASRDGYSQRDALQLLHPRPATPEYGALFGYIDDVWRKQQGRTPRNGLALPDGDVGAYLAAVAQLKELGCDDCALAYSVPQAVKLITDFQLPREVVPTKLLTSADVWAALLPHMGLTALVRNLPTMTRVGLLAPLSDAERAIRVRLQDATALKRSRVHPIQLLTAQLTYQSGHSLRGNSSWTPVPSVVDALDEAFYQSFANVVPTGKRLVLALDVSGSMDSGAVAGVPGLTPRVAAAALAMVTARTEQNYVVVGFTSGGTGESRWYGRNSAISVLNVSPRMRLSEVCGVVNRRDFGGTDCALPMQWAAQNNIEADGFAVYTDSETWAGTIHPSQALRQYRERTGIGAKEAVVGMVSNSFSIADPNDRGMLDVVGFDTATPAVLADFFRYGY